MQNKVFLDVSKTNFMVIRRKDCKLFHNWQRTSSIIDIGLKSYVYVGTVYT